MRSVPFAMTWEMLCRGWWVLIAAALGANLLPVLLESSLSRFGDIDGHDPSQIIMHMVLVQLNIFIFAAAVIAAQGNLSRLYAAPIPTTTLVTWHLLPAMLLVGAEFVVSTLALNAAFGLDWPIWGPALFAMVSVATVNAALWQTEKTAWLILAFGTVASLSGLWYRSRHGSLFGDPKHYWDHVTIAEFATLLVVTVISYYAAVTGVARSRRGDTLPSLGIVEWLKRFFDPAPEVGAPFKNASDAHFWFVWYQKGWAMPACVVFGGGFAFLMWLIGDRTAKTLMIGLVSGGAILPVVGFLAGLILGNVGSSDSSFEMGNYLGTRPLTSREMSRIILKTMFRTVGISWGIWAVTLALVYGFLRAIGLNPLLEMEPGKGIEMWYIYVPVTLLGPWIVCVVFASLGLTGRAWVFMGAVVGGLTLWFGGVTISQLALSSAAQESLLQIVTGTLGVLFVLGTMAAYFAARRQSLIESATIYKAVLAWLVLCLPVVLLGILRPVPPVSMYVLVMGLMALAVAPISTVPLALTWNRVR